VLYRMLYISVCSFFGFLSCLFVYVCYRSHWQTSAYCLLLFDSVHRLKGARVVPANFVGVDIYLLAPIIPPVFAVWCTAGEEFCCEFCTLLASVVVNFWFLMT